MTRKIPKISLLEGIVLLLTGLFAVGTLLWFQLSRPADGVTFVQTQTADRQVQAPEQPAAPGMLPGEVLNLNQVSQADLTRLPGIGEKKAAAIVAWRQAHGDFSKIEDLLEVRGIGQGILDRIRPYVTVGGAPAEEGAYHGTNSGGG